MGAQPSKLLEDWSVKPLRFNLLTLLGAILGAASIYLTWVNGREVAILGPRLPRAPPPTGPFGEPMNLLETTFIQYSAPEFWIGCFFFVVGTVLVFYSVWGVASQIIGYLAFLHAYATASWVNPIASDGVGPKLALVSILLCGSSLLFPYWIGRDVGKKGFVNRFLTVDPGGRPRLLLPSVLAISGAVVIFLSLMTTYSSYRQQVNDDTANAASALLAAAAFILLGLAYARLISDTAPLPEGTTGKDEEDEFAWLRQMMARWKIVAAIAVAVIVILAVMAFAYWTRTCELTVTITNDDPDQACQYGLYLDGVMRVNETLSPGQNATMVFSVTTGWHTVEVDYVWLNDTVVKGLGSSMEFDESIQLMPFEKGSMAYIIPASP